MNQAYAPVGRGNLIMVKKAKDFREKVITFTPYWDIPGRERKPLFMFQCNIHDNWFRKDKKDLLKKDIGNLRKILIDAVFYKWGIDDKYIWLDGPFLKYQEADSGKKKLVVKVKVLEWIMPSI